MGGASNFRAVKVYEDTLELPTYLIKGENPNPVFRSQYGVALIYPYTLLDHIDSRPTLKTYRALVLENAYLRVTVIPDLGGRVYSVFDKVSQAEVFYKNHVVKFSPLAIRGAFFSGGIEFSFPVAHAPTTADPVNWSIRQNADESASISFGGIEHLSRMKWMVTLTLFPDRCALAQDVTLTNPYFLPGRYHYWTNASLDADDQTEFIYPFRRARSYEFSGSAPWPMARLDLIRDDPGLPGMEGTPKWPVDIMHDPLNLRWQKNILTHLSVFGRDITWNFFGAWQHSKNRGYVHCADPRFVAGMKLWSWGNAPIGIVNQSALTDDGSLYAETQCGALETQLDFDFLSPFATKSWREWWVPLRGINGVSCANEDVAVNIRLMPTHSDPYTYQLVLGVCPARAFPGVEIILRTPNQTLIAEKRDIAPEHPAQMSREVDTRGIADNPLIVQIFDAQGKVLLDYVFDRKPSRRAQEEEASKTFAPTKRSYYEQGLYYEKLDQRDHAITYYRKALEENPNHPLANLRLGLLYVRAADFQRASRHLQTALSNAVDDARYFLGFIATQQNHIDEAFDQFRSLPAASDLYVPAHVNIAGLLIRQNRLDEAITTVTRVLEAKPEVAVLHVLLGTLYRKAGHPTKAAEVLGRAVQMDPLNHAALWELGLITGDAQYHQTLTRLLSDDRQYILDLAGYYIGFGCYKDALQVLERFKALYPYPMLGYLGYWINHALGREAQAQEWYQWARDCKPDLCFPSRLEEILALLTAIEHHPDDFKAHYYLGNFLYARQRYDEAIQCWEKAAQGMGDFDVLYRNLGWAMWKYKEDPLRAVEYFERALAINPLNQDLYLHLDDLYKLLGRQADRRKLLERIEALPDLREDVRKRRVLMLVELGEEDKALYIMQNETFVPLEMDQTFHDVYVQALLQRAEKHLQAGRPEQAIEDYQKALEYPVNLGVGQPPDLKQAQIYYLLGLAYERIGRYQDALDAWYCAAKEYHPSHSALYPYVESALDKINRYTELGLEPSESVRITQSHR
ncbi:DUF5107 domain-containing protein [Thermanaerothrix sp.]|uniref:DUF5107 domain-containing protein n=1 Tax=Thermanaerothrix sp. TaxID=2972675 RepID=UPI002ADE795D|nr:DUF5107 domain-containing protein [Thermanaerothrix sp.]